MSEPDIVVERAPDGWTHIGGPGMHVLVALDEDDDRTLSASDAADGGDLDDVIDVLTAGGLRRAVNFVGVHWKPTTRIVALGPVAAEVTVAGTGPDPVVHEIRPTSRRVWTDIDLADHPGRVVIKVLGRDRSGDDPTPGTLPIRIGAPLGGTEPTAPPTEAGPEAPTAAPAAAPAAEPPLPVFASSAPEPVVETTPEPTPEPTREPTPERTVEPAPDLRPDVESTWAGRPTTQPDPAPVVDPAPETDAAPSYDYLFGHTVAADEHRKVLSDLRRDVDDGDDSDDTDDDVEETEGPATDAVAASTATAHPSGATEAVAGPVIPDGAARSEGPAAVPSAGGLISSVPWATAATTAAASGEPATPSVPTFAGRHTPPPAPSLLPPALLPSLPRPSVDSPETESTGSTDRTDRTGSTDITEPSEVAPSPAVADPPTEDEEAALTVDRSALIEARHVARTSTGSGPTVLAVLCGSGHPSPPHADTCRVCGGDIPTQEPFTMPRPPLGVLRLTSGDVVTLDRSVLLGRSPKPGDGLAAADRPHVVKVPSPERDVSRNHLEVLLEGWHVLVRDLGTTNGTTVTLPGHGPVRVRANDQQVLEPGSVVSLADEVSFTFEVEE